MHIDIYTKCTCTSSWKGGPPNSMHVPIIKKHTRAHYSKCGLLIVVFSFIKCDIWLVVRVKSGCPFSGENEIQNQKQIFQLWIDLPLEGETLRLNWAELFCFWEKETFRAVQTFGFKVCMFCFFADNKRSQGHSETSTVTVTVTVTGNLLNTKVLTLVSRQLSPYLSHMQWEKYMSTATIAFPFVNYW